MKKLILCALALLLYFDAEAQLAPYGQHDMEQGQYDLLKYWNLRDRMDWWVMKGAAHTFGNCPDINTYFGYGLAPSHLYIIQRPFSSDTTTYLQFGDSGQQLGWYIATLATEYELLRRHGLNTDRTVEDLYYAMEAVFRVDYLAENMNPYSPDTDNDPNPNNHECSHNGFFVRSDIGAWMVNGGSQWDWHDNPRSPYPNLLTEAAKPSRTLGSKPDAEKTNNCESRDAGTFWPIPKTKVGTGKGCANGMSQDQVAHIFMGLTFVDKYLPDQNLLVRYDNPVNGSGVLVYNFKAKTKVFIEKLIDRLWKNNYWLTYPQLDKNVTRGEFALGISVPLFTIAKDITGRKTKDLVHNGYQLVLMWNAWDALTQNIFIARAHTQAFTLSLAAVSNRRSDNWLETWSNTKFGIYPLMRWAVHGKGLDKKNRDTPDAHFPEQLLLMDCYGPRRCNNAKKAPDFPLDLPRFTTRTADKAWYGGNRFIGGVRDWVTEAEAEDDEPHDDDKVDRQFVGFDYMLFFNLYQLYEEDRYSESHVKEYRNYKHNELHPKYPVSPGGWGSFSNPAFEFSFYPIIYDGEVDSLSEVYIVSHERVEIHARNITTPAELNGNSRAYPMPFDCKDYPGPDVNIYKTEPEPDTLIAEDEPAEGPEEENEGLYEFLQEELSEAEINEIFAHFIENGYLTAAQIDSIKAGAYSEAIYAGLSEFSEAYNEALVKELETQQQIVETLKPKIAVFPNPFHAGVKFTLELPEAAPVTIRLYTVVGQEVKTLAQGEELPAGSHARSFDLSDLPGGAYVCKVWIGGDFQTFKLMKE